MGERPSIAKATGGYYDGKSASGEGSDFGVKLASGSPSAIRFPEHASGERLKPSIRDVIIGIGAPNLARAKCEKNVRNVLKNNPHVKLMAGAMKSVGCPVDVNRHINCELCDVSVHGGFDPVNKQIVVCQNIATSEGKVASVLTHEMIHAFDFCRSTFDVKNIDHVACSEVRASAITHCSFLSAFFGGDASPFDYKNRHRDCVRVRATESVKSCMNSTFEEAHAAVERVFPKCYHDLEPFGRIPRRNSRDTEKAYYERIYYGYDV